jgi:hypothetical protein
MQRNLLSVVAWKALFPYGRCFFFNLSFIFFALSSISFHLQQLDIGMFPSVGNMPWMHLFSGELYSQEIFILSRVLP